MRYDGRKRKRGIAQTQKRRNEQLRHMRWGRMERPKHSPPTRRVSAPLMGQEPMRLIVQSSGISDV
jgi:hypothetical protein